LVPFLAPPSFFYHALYYLSNITDNEKYRGEKFLRMVSGLQGVDELAW
jgi:hypothetical protein